jgi:hypothetical protein
MLQLSLDQIIERGMYGSANALLRWTYTHMFIKNMDLYTTINMNQQHEPIYVIFIVKNGSTFEPSNHGTNQAMKSRELAITRSICIA